jgi:hypothetical protein
VLPLSASSFLVFAAFVSRRWFVSERREEEARASEEEQCRWTVYLKKPKGAPSALVRTMNNHKSSRVV